MSINGTLNLCKPTGPTSFDIVRKVKSLTHQKKVGHGGTLDPLASGVLPICIGQATRISEFLADSSKSYRAEVTLGVATDTYDAEGTVTSTADPSSITYSQLEEVSQQFQGPILQEPPMFSALKHEGKRLYQLARQGIVIEREKRETIIHRLDIIEWSPPVITMEIECGRGAYVRSLAHDLGQALGCGAHLKGLVRLKTGPFDIKDSMTIEELIAVVEEGRWEQFLYPTDFAIADMHAAILDSKAERAAISGQPIPIIYADYKKVPEPAISAVSSNQSPGTPIRCRAFSLDGRFLAILSAPTPRGPWAPKKVFPPN